MVILDNLRYKFNKKKIEKKVIQSKLTAHAMRNKKLQAGNARHAQ